jgi:DNA-binding IclR family transcriptional regulator
MEAPSRLSATVIKAAKVLDAVVQSSIDGVALRDLATERVGRSTTHRLLRTLSHVGLVKAIRNGRYTVGPVLLQYSLQIGQAAPWLRDAQAVVADIAREIDETVTLSLLTPTMERVVVYSAESTQTVRWVATPGVHSPLYYGASGRAILAAMDRDALEAYLLDVRTELPEGLALEIIRSQVEEDRRRGYATSIAEQSADGAATATAIAIQGEAVFGAISIAVPVSRFDEGVARRHGRTTNDAARRIAELIGGPG